MLATAIAVGSSRAAAAAIGATSASAHHLCKSVCRASAAAASCLTAACHAAAALTIPFLSTAGEGAAVPGAQVDSGAAARARGRRAAQPVPGGAFGAGCMRAPPKVAPRGPLKWRDGYNGCRLAQTAVSNPSGCCSPGPPSPPSVQHQATLRDKTKQMKSLASELNMYQTQVGAQCTCAVLMSAALCLAARLSTGSSSAVLIRYPSSSSAAPPHIM